MTITVVQSSGVSGDSVSTVSRAFSSNVAVGNLVVVPYFRYTNPQDTPVAADCTKNAGTATIGTVSLDVVAARSYGGGPYIYAAVWSAEVTGAGTLTMQVAGQANDYVGIGIAELHSNLGSITFETSANNNGSGTAPDSGNGSSAGAAIFIGSLFLASSGVVTITEDGAFSLIFEEQNGSNHATGSTIYRIVSGATTDSASWTISPTEQWAAALAVYKEPGAATKGIVRLRRRYQFWKRSF